MSGGTLAAVAVLLAELRTAFTDPADPPAGGLLPQPQHRGGMNVALDVGGEDEGCTGMAWVNVMRRYRTTAFPAEDPAPECSPGIVAVINVGVARCAQVMTEGGDPPSPAVLEAEALAVLDDADRLELALCRASRQLLDDQRPTGPIAHQVAVGAWDATGPEGQVIAGVQTITVHLRSM